MNVNALVPLLVTSGLLCVLLYLPATTYLSRSLVSPYPKADMRRRVYAAMIDGLLVATSWLAYQSAKSVVFVVAGALYLLLRDAVRGQSLGKFLMGLVVVSLETGRPATLRASVWRNALLLIPGANVPAIFLEAYTMMRDTQGQRLGDRLAQTQVVEGFGAKDLVEALHHWWRSALADLPQGARPKRGPVVIDRG
jgi:uncharacterized RDD family membrane protein YckC